MNTLPLLKRIFQWDFNATLPQLSFMAAAHLEKSI